MKRSASQNLVENPFVKDKNKTWAVDLPSFSSRVSPPPTPKKQRSGFSPATPTSLPSTAAVEAGKVEIQDHLSYFSDKLLKATRPLIPAVPRLQHEDWIALYKRHQNPQGHHFIIHQHDHPIAGTHYDLRLQCNETSSISFAIMYGLPGDPNSRRLNRNAMETRVHNVWNHLIETASYTTGSMLIWDTGYYTMLPFRKTEPHSETEESEDQDPCQADQVQSESEKLATAFSQRKLRLELHGTRLPKGYTISLRLTKDNFTSIQPKKPSRRRRRPDPRRKTRRPVETSSDSDASSNTVVGDPKHIASLLKTESPPKKVVDDNEQAIALASEDEDEAIRLNNAYTGATNTIGSIHQRRWFLSLDRRCSGFVPENSKDQGRKRWVRRREPDGTLAGFEKFIVMGRDGERSVVTGRFAKDVLQDEGVQGYVPRGLWRPVTE